MNRFRVINTVVAALIVIGLTAPQSSAVEILPSETTTPATSLLVDEAIGVPAEEAEDMAESLQEVVSEPGIPMVTVYEPRLIESADFEEASTLFVPFPVPDECNGDAPGDTVKCDIANLDFETTVLDDAGQAVPHESSAASSAVTIAISSEQPYDFPLVATVYLSERDEQTIVEGAEDTLSWMLATDGQDHESPAELEQEEADLTEVSLAADWNLGSQASTFAFTTSPDALIVPMAAISRPSKVTIPASYRYCPWTCTPKSLHDYCTTSPDSHGASVLKYGRVYETLRADFRGPCARHDMGIDNIRKKNISLSSKRSQRAESDLKFRSRLKQNCSHAFYESRSTAARNGCYSKASLYYSIVSDVTRTWMGR